ncbi:MAG: hypothetical protein QGI47_06120 [Candidatus Marinimicrobia bacterium]|jgi:hypothetical protein|uniref:Uncharacterized protein n=1 Tax=marine metagenome TaxID=408172 RepID=A0A381RR90_9ZZZZ|nr:hypothetical protein [Candidatus Neomarinimicrobiota bacterium]
MRYFFLFLLLVNPAFGDTITGYDLYRSLNKKYSTNVSDYHDYETASAYIMGVVNAMAHSRTVYTKIIAEYIPNKKAGANLGIVLMPLSRQWQVEQYIEVVHLYLRKHPEHLKLSAIENISLSLFEASIAAEGQL